MGIPIGLRKIYVVKQLTDDISGISYGLTFEQWQHGIQTAYSYWVSLHKASKTVDFAVDIVAQSHMTAGRTFGCISTRGSNGIIRSTK